MSHAREEGVPPTREKLEVLQRQSPSLNDEVAKGEVGQGLTDGTASNAADDDFELGLFEGARHAAADEGREWVRGARICEVMVSDGSKRISRKLTELEVPDSVQPLYILAETFDDVRALPGEVAQGVEHGEARVGVSLKCDELDLSGDSDVESAGIGVLSESEETLAADGVLVDDSKRFTLPSAGAVLKDDEMEPSSGAGCEGKFLLG